MKVQVITDSTADIQKGLAEELGIVVVPIYLRFGDKIYRDGIDIQRKEFYAMLETSPVHPATSQPNPEDFTEVYRKYCGLADGIVSIHISSRISGTCNSALMAKITQGSLCPIEVIDSRFNSAGLGLVVEAAARLAMAGAAFGEVVDEAKRAINQEIPGAQRQGKQDNCRSLGVSPRDAPSYLSRRRHYPRRDGADDL
jgi:DegV family protein with EDD domain